MTMGRTHLDHCRYTAERDPDHQHMYCAHDMSASLFGALSLIGAPRRLRGPLAATYSLYNVATWTSGGSSAAETSLQDHVVHRSSGDGGSVGTAGPGGTSASVYARSVSA